MSCPTESVQIVVVAPNTFTVWSLAEIEILRKNRIYGLMLSPSFSIPTKKHRQNNNNNNNNSGNVGDGLPCTLPLRLSIWEVKIALELNMAQLWHPIIEWDETWMNKNFQIKQQYLEKFLPSSHSDLWLYNNNNNNNNNNDNNREHKDEYWMYAMEHETGLSMDMDMDMNIDTNRDRDIDMDKRIGMPPHKKRKLNIESNTKTTIPSNETKLMSSKDMLRNMIGAHNKFPNIRITSTIDFVKPPMQLQENITDDYWLQYHFHGDKQVLREMEERYIVFRDMWYERKYWMRADSYYCGHFLAYHTHVHLCHASYIILVLHTNEQVILEKLLEHARSCKDGNIRLKEIDISLMSVARVCVGVKKELLCAYLPKENDSQSQSQPKKPKYILVKWHSSKSFTNYGYEVIDGFEPPVCKHHYVS